VTGEARSSRELRCEGEGSVARLGREDSEKPCASLILYASMGCLCLTTIVYSERIGHGHIYAVILEDCGLKFVG
jgi:hypothetical protein